MLTVTINGRAYGPREVRDELSMNDFLREYLGMTDAEISALRQEGVIGTNKRSSGSRGVYKTERLKKEER